MQHRRCYRKVRLLLQKKAAAARGWKQEEKEVGYPLLVASRQLVALYHYYYSASSKSKRQLRWCYLPREEGAFLLEEVAELAAVLHVLVLLRGASFCASFSFP